MDKKEENIIKTAQNKSKETKKDKSFLRDMIEIIGVALIVTFIVRGFIMDVFWIPSRSMVPTLEVNDRIVASRMSYWFDGPERGDVVVFEYPLDTSKDYVKRAIGMPGEVVMFKDNKLYINGEMLDEPYLTEDVMTYDYGPVTVPEGSYFMCGDNRTGSSDSREWGFVSEDLIKAKGQFIYWPFDRLGGI